MKFHVILVRFNESKLIDGEKSFDFANLLHTVPLDLLLFDTQKKVLQQDCRLIGFIEWYA
jgi:hypothetical protein